MNPKIFALPKLFKPMLRTTIWCILLCGTSLSIAAEPDPAKGEKIYSKSCGGCHDTRVHTRANRIVHTYADLVNRVRYCDNNTKSNFTEQDILDVSEYLNQSFYKFIKVKDK